MVEPTPAVDLPAGHAVGPLAMLAQNTLERLKGVSDYWNEPRNPWWSLLFWGCVLALGTIFLIAAARHSRRRNRATPGPGPWRVFFSLLLRLELSWPQRWMLYRLARRVSPDCPAAVLLSPSALAKSARTWATQSGRSPDEFLARRIAPVSRVLFGEQPAPGRDV